MVGSLYYLIQNNISKTKHLNANTALIFMLFFSMKATVLYIAAAETGYEVAGFNAAFMMAEHKVSLFCIAFSSILI